ncbi:acyl-CoA dehydrogenase family protein [Nonomuraea harbinensis]|uniref:Acyl-CoA dehydrogenase family protein n=1 Tax=Nonomuraea harbinensis TaxID=1286938 RepID=A0ABW1BP34_9ACTN|nr:acyl-CoA dehydrogenase family protein [Nonomuraea harbinensis]
MGIGLTTDHRALAGSVRGLAERGADHGALARQGVLGLHLPEERGGQGYGLLELCVALEALGELRVPGPYLPTVLAAAAAARSPAAKDLTDGLANGSLTATVVLPVTDGLAGTEVLPVTDGSAGPEVLPVTDGSAAPVMPVTGGPAAPVCLSQTAPPPQSRPSQAVPPPRPGRATSPALCHPARTAGPPCSRSGRRGLICFWCRWVRTAGRCSIAGMSWRSPPQVSTWTVTCAL